MKDLDHYTQKAQGYRHSGIILFGVAANGIKELSGIDVFALPIMQAITSSEVLSTLGAALIGFVLMHFKGKADLREPKISLDDELVEATGRTGDLS